MSSLFKMPKYEPPPAINTANEALDRREERADASEKRELRKIKVAGGFNAEQAIRVYIWNQQGMEVPGLSKKDIKELVDFVENNINYKQYADKLIFINKGDEYSKPGFGWLAGTVATDLTDGVNSIKRERYLTESGWLQNIDIILSEKNLNKLEAAFVKKYREALESFIKRMKTGRNRNYEGDSLTGNFDSGQWKLDYLEAD